MGDSSRPAAEPGRQVVVVIGIDKYAELPTLNNAKSDALAVRDLFVERGFTEVVEPLLNELATCQAMQRLVVEELSMLGPHDSLVVFFAGHGRNYEVNLHDRKVLTGYLMPADAEQREERRTAWLRLDSWLSDIAILRAKHILVILDACNSGIALNALVKWRQIRPLSPAAEALQARRSRQLITSALADQQAMDSGPLPNHSLFTGCLIEALRGGIAPKEDRNYATSSQLAAYLQERVTSYPNSRQTPDFGALALDDSGELFIPLLARSADQPEALPRDRDPSEKANIADLTYDPVVPRSQGAHRARHLISIGVLSLLLTCSTTAELGSDTPFPKGAPAGLGVVQPKHLSIDDAARPLALDTFFARNPFVEEGALVALSHVVTCEEIRFLPAGQSKITCGAGGLAQATRLEDAASLCRLLGARLPTHDECLGMSWVDNTTRIWSASLQQEQSVVLVHICQNNSSNMRIRKEKNPLSIGVRCVR